MRKITSNELAAGVAEKWREAYQNRDRAAPDGWFVLADGRSSGVIYDELVALGPSPKPKNVARVIGNTSWTDIPCLGCGAYVNIAVEIVNDGNGLIAICPACVSDADGMLA